jgi:hypothetical protein
MAKKRYPRPQAGPAEEPSPALQQILCGLGSPDPAFRAGAVRQLCPCRGANWEIPVFPRVLALRNDPSPVVRHAVEHDLRENPDWGERQEARRMEGLRQRKERQRVEEEIRAGGEAGEPPAPHSLAWRTPRRPRSKKQHYPPRRPRMPAPSF